LHAPWRALEPFKIQYHEVLPDVSKTANRRASQEALRNPTAKEKRMTEITQLALDQIIGTYKKVSPSSSISEVRAAASMWWKQEDAGEYSAGCCHHDYRPAAIFAMEAVRSLNTGVDGKADAIRLLKLALNELA
jgi:hypothetical protein